jgi:RNA polymerase sigma factor (sigma-70 family)
MTDPSSRLRTVIKQLPFAVDDTDAANDAFRRWTEEKDPQAQRLVDMWTYCYVCRYFLAKSAGDSFDSTAAPDKLITRTYEKIQENRDGVRDASRYTNWVSVICKNTFLNYTRRDRTSDSIDKEKGPTLRADTRCVPEQGFVREAFSEAIDRLPDYLQEPARLYFLEDREFEEISEEIGKAVPTVRTYKHKAMKKLREDERLREYVDQPDL